MDMPTLLELVEQFEREADQLEADDRDDAALRARQDAARLREWMRDGVRYYLSPRREDRDFVRFKLADELVVQVHSKSRAESIADKYMRLAKRLGENDFDNAAVAVEIGKAIALRYPVETIAEEAIA
jgi:hypothetical protein